MNIFNHRPPCEGQPGCESWEDNKISNAMAWSSDLIGATPLCKRESWMTKVVIYVWADCGCCLFWRGVALGACAGGAAAVTLFTTITQLM